jgi:hypothetical protein
MQRSNIMRQRLTIRWEEVGFEMMRWSSARWSAESGMGETGRAISVTLTRN